VVVPVTAPITIVLLITSSNTGKTVLPIVVPEVNLTK
jgi:hypothetical protein